VLSPWYTLRRDLQGQFFNAWVPTAVSYLWRRPTDKHGWTRPLTTQPGPEMLEKRLRSERESFAPSLAEFRMREHAAAALRDTLDLCRAERIPVFLVLMPERSPFRAMYSSDALERLFGFVHELADEYGCSVVNAREWVPDDCFGDGHHLQQRGALLFSERLA